MQIAGFTSCRKPLSRKRAGLLVPRCLSAPGTSQGIPLPGWGNKGKLVGHVVDSGTARARCPLSGRGIPIAVDGGRAHRCLFRGDLASWVV